MAVLSGLRALEWAWQNFFCTSIENYKTNKNLNNISTGFSKVWAWHFCAVCGRGNMGQQTCSASLSLESVCSFLTMLNLAFIVPEISTFIRLVYWSWSGIYI